MARLDLFPGMVAYVDFGGNRGREQSGIRPGVIISSDDYSEARRELTIVVPCSTRDRGWPNHVLLEGASGLDKPTFAMTEQVRAIDRERILRVVGAVNDSCIERLGRWVGTWLHKAA